MFRWTEQSLHWYRQAAAYGDFHTQLAARLTPYLAPSDTVFDLGCGAGYLSLALAAHVRLVTAVDIDPHALEGLRRAADARRLPNLELLRADCTMLPDGLTRDVAVLCFFGQMAHEENMRRYLRCCNKSLIAIVGDTGKSDIAPSGVSRRGKHRTAEIEAFLQTRGIAYTLVRDTLEYGQPFESMAEGKAFIRHYAPDCSDEEAHAHLKKHCTHLPDGRYYLPNKKKLGIFVVTKSANLK